MQQVKIITSAMSHLLSNYISASLAVMVAMTGLALGQGAALPAKITGLEVDIQNQPTDWSSVIWHADDQNNIYIIYSGALTNPDGSAKTFSFDVSFSAKDDYEIKLANTTPYDPPVTTHIETGYSVNAQNVATIPFVLVDGSEMDIPGTVHILPEVEISIEVEVPSTPALTSRASNGWPTPANLKFDKTINPAPDLTAAFPDAHFGPSNALVLIKNNAVTMPVTATSNSGNDVKLKVLRDSADVSAVGTGPFSLTPLNAENSATMRTDARGSFYLVGYVDRNDNNSIDATEPCGVLPVIIVDVNLVAEVSSFDPSNFKAIADNTANQRCRIETGKFDYVNKANAGAQFAAFVDMVGGLDGKRGVDRVFGGWCNNFKDLRINADYTSGSKSMGVVTSDSGPFLPASVVQSVDVTSQGAGYTAAPTITLTGGGGSGAMASVAGFGVSNIAVTNGGAGYTSPPTVSITTTGNGSGATATATVANGAVTGITVTNPGAGYTGSITVSISGGGGANATAGVAGYGISDITVTAIGTSYTSSPTVTITGGGGAGATANATLWSSAAPTIVSGTLLDATDHQDTATGGGTIAIGWNTPTAGRRSNVTDVFDSPSGLGVRKKIEDIDSPGAFFRYRHPGFAERTLENIEYDIEFELWLLCWTNVDADFFATGLAGERSYHAMARRPWVIDSNWDVSFSPSPPPASGALSATVTASGTPTIDGGQYSEYSPVRRPAVDADVDCETRPPLILKSYKTDYR